MMIDLDVDQIKDLLTDPAVIATFGRCQAVTATGYRCKHPATKTMVGEGDMVGLCATHAAIWTRGGVVTWGPVGWEGRCPETHNLVGRKR